MAGASMDDLFSMDLNPDVTPTPTQTTPTKRSGATPTNSPIKRSRDLNDTDKDLLDLVKLETEGDCPILYLLVYSYSDMYYLQATDGRQGWVGAISHQHIKENAKNAKGSEEAFLRDTEVALTEASSGYLYTTVLKPSDNSLEFSWKKHLVKQDIKVFLGSVVMETHATPALHLKMLDFAVSKMTEQHKTIDSLQLEKNRLIKEREMTLKRLEETINLKEEIEGDLYGKFKLVLNEKKAKIRRLMESVEYLSSNQTLEKAKSGEPLERRDSVGADDEGIEEEDGGEKEMTPSPKSKSNDGTKYSSGSILTDEWQSEITSPPVKRRKREQKKTATDLSNLQRPPSIPRSGSSDQENLQRSCSTSSETSRQENDEPLGSQDLINMM